MAIHLSKEDKLALESTSECYMVGVLADENDADGYEQFYVIDNAITFRVRAISDRPNPIGKLDDLGIYHSENYTGFDKYLINSPLGMPVSYKYNSNYEEKVKIIKEKLENKLIIFKPIININKQKRNESSNPYTDLHDDVYKVYKNLKITSTEEMPSMSLDDMSYIPIPFVKYKTNDFDEMLFEEQHIEFSEYSENYLSPEYILCNDHLYFDFDGWEQHPTNKKSRKCINKEENWKKIKLSNEDLSNVEYFIRASDNLVFINDNFAREIVDNFEYDTEKITKEDETRDRNLGVIPISKDISLSEDDDLLKESLFINALKEYTLSRNLSYTTKDLINLHICIKTNLMTILTGMTGTGKSEITRAYAKMLDLSIENENLLFMPISPNYTEPSDVIGYMNTTLGLYNSAETGLIDFIIKASKNPEKLFMVIFDEMNLSQVEHWFAPFISLLEVEESNRYLNLYSHKTKCLNDEQYPHKIKIGSNIRFVGTMNVDETTKDISDRLLDRANTITLSKISFVDLINNIDEYDLSKSTFEQHICRKYDDYNKWIQKENSLNAFNKSEIEFFDSLHNLIIKYDTQKGVSFRVLQRMGIYLNNIPDLSGVEGSFYREEAIDLQVKQRIITKIKGTAKQFSGLIGNHEFGSNQVIDSSLLELLDREDIRKISDFKETRKEILRKSQELSLYGYTN